MASAIAPTPSSSEMAGLFARGRASARKRDEPGDDNLQFDTNAKCFMA
jgi:hypothetical protein